jgi:hypothetical protein
MAPPPAMLPVVDGVVNVHGVLHPLTVRTVHRQVSGAPPQVGDASDSTVGAWVTRTCQSVPPVTNRAGAEC